MASRDGLAGKAKNDGILSKKLAPVLWRNEA